MDDDEVLAFLTAERIVNVATIGPTGHPHVMPMWFAVVDGKISFTTYGKSQKIVNLLRDPKVTALVESGGTYEELKGVELLGHGVIVDDAEEAESIGRAIGEKYSSGVPSAAPAASVKATRRVAVVIEVYKTVSWDHSKLRGKY